MKKLTTSIICLAAMAFSAITASGQAVCGYTATTSQGTYTPLTGGTVIYNGAAEGATVGSGISDVYFTPAGEATEEGTATGYAIGFDYPFAGVKKSSFLVSGSGYIALGNDQVDVKTGTGWNYLNNWEKDLQVLGFAPHYNITSTAESRVEYALTGTGDAQRLVVQFSKFGMSNSIWGDPVPVDFQIQLHPNGDFSCVVAGLGAFITAEDPEPNAPGFRAGIRALEYLTCLQGTVPDVELVHSGVSDLCIPASTPDGFTVTFKAPGKCVAPTAQATALELTSTSTTVSGTFTAAEGADTYLVVRSTKADATWAPANGTTYEVGQVNDDIDIAYFGTDCEFSTDELPGGTTYYYTVYAAVSFGVEGPAYNLTAPLKGTIATKPAGATGEVKAADTNSITIDLAPNAAGDEIVVVMNTYCERDNFGNHGLCAAPVGTAKVGDILPVPEDFEPYRGFEAPENGGKVVYVGNGGEGIVIGDLAPSTLYFLGVYSRNAAGECTTDIVYLDASTNIVAPYEGNSVNFPFFDLPADWTTSEANAETRTFTFVDQQNYNVTETTQAVQQYCKINRGNAQGCNAWLAPNPIVVDARHLMARFQYAITESASRFDTHCYNDWAEGDALELQVSEDNGTTWTTLAKYDNTNNPKQEAGAEPREVTYFAIEADLNEYRGKTVLVRLNWTTCTTAAWGVTMYVDRFSVKQAEFPEVPVITVTDITLNSANITWKSSQTDYQLIWREKDSEITSVVTVKGAMAYSLKNLEVNSTYTVSVRGILPDDQYTEWSDPVEFTTLDWPAVDAPADLQSNLDAYFTDGVVLTWAATEDMESYEVAYRESSATEWTTVTTDEPTLTLKDLKYETRYIWKVRAFCTHDRETEFSAQANFTTPDESAGITDITADDAANAELYTITGIRVNPANAQPGIYILRSNGKTSKVRL